MAFSCLWEFQQNFIFLYGQKFSNRHIFFHYFLKPFRKFKAFRNSLKMVTKMKYMSPKPGHFCSNDLELSLESFDGHTQSSPVQWVQINSKTDLCTVLSHLFSSYNILASKTLKILRKLTKNQKLASYTTSIIYLTCYFESFVPYRWIVIHGPVQ